MKQRCKIEVKSVRNSLLGDSVGAFSAENAEEFWDHVEADGILPEEFFDPDTSDRQGDALYMEPDLPEPNESVLTSYGIVDRVIYKR